MQGIKEFIQTEKKAAYINQLLKVGFHTIDFGSFVSSKAIPQMQDTEKVLKMLDLSSTSSKLLAIVANLRGAEQAADFDEITYLGFPFSISETFQQRNTNSSVNESLKRVEEIQKLCLMQNKKLVIYISMAFGNPYGDEWNNEIVIQWTRKIASMGIQIIALSDTIGIAEPSSISHLFSAIIPEFKDIEIGAHLHTTPFTWEEKVQAAYNNGCKRFDSAIKGYGGCPMAKDDLTGNMPTEKLLGFFKSQNIETGINSIAFDKAMEIAEITFPQ
ncbi:MAG: hydroxymethylglutaryl-CoA lyase [Bacteroidetes bacterium]|nr:hydroxymethylglutaryl-CoA lyase [Bacteroidota bacterium]